MNTIHYPVMHKEVVDAMQATKRQVFVDCTLGLGGHADHLLRTFPAATVIGIDVDNASLIAAQDNLADYADRLTLVRSSFMDMWSQLPVPAEAISGILVDPGLSMAQLKEAARGFSHSYDGPLDMRKDRTQSLTAATVLNTYSEQQLSDIFTRYAEDRDSRAIAKKVIEARLFKPFSTTGQFSELIAQSKHWWPKKGSLHPAARFFQALRIVVNRELDGLDVFILSLPRYLKRGARFVFISYHSVEDRIVKQCMAQLAKLKKIIIIKPFPIFPSAAEIEGNPPSRSARMRVGEVA